MNISSQNHQSPNELVGTFGKKNKKESALDALMKLGEVPTKEGKKGKPVFSLGENTSTLRTEKKEQVSAIPASVLFGKAETTPSTLEEKKEGMVDTPSKRKNEAKTEVKMETKVEGKDKKDTPTEPRLDEKIATAVTMPVFQVEKLSINTNHRSEKKDTTQPVQFALTDFSQSTPKPAMTLPDIKQEQQLMILKELAKQLSEHTAQKQETFSMTEAGKTKSTWIQLPLHDGAVTNATEGRKTADVSASHVTSVPKEMKKTKELEVNKSDSIMIEPKMDNSPRNEPLKAEAMREIKNLITQEIEQYIEFKEVNSKKVSMVVQHEALGNLDIQIERKDDKIYILLKVDDLANKEKVEQTLEHLKQELKEKEIDVEYEVEQEGQQKEKRKEQEALMEKENKREKQGEEEQSTIKFDELLEVGL